MCCCYSVPLQHYYDLMQRAHMLCTGRMHAYPLMSHWLPAVAVFGVPHTSGVILLES